MKTRSLRTFALLGTWVAFMAIAKSLHPMTTASRFLGWFVAFNAALIVTVVILDRRE